MSDHLDRLRTTAERVLALIPNDTPTEETVEEARELHQSLRWTTTRVAEHEERIAGVLVDLVAALAESAAIRVDLQDTIRRFEVRFEEIEKDPCVLCEGTGMAPSRFDTKAQRAAMNRMRAIVNGGVA